MKGKKRFIALLLSFLMVLSQMSVATFALDTVADENADQTVEEQAAEETQPEAEAPEAAAEAEPAATEPAAEETATEPEVAEPAAEEPAEAEPAKAAAKKAAPAKAAAKKAEPEKAEEEKAEAFDQSQTVDGVTVNVSAAKGVFPAGSKLSVSKISVPDAVDTSDAEAAYAFDISILANGKKIQPDGKATVSFTTAGAADYDTAVYHMDGGAQKMSVSESGDTATVKTDGFSAYVYVLFLNVVKPETNEKSVEVELNKRYTFKEIFEMAGVEWPEPEEDYLPRNNLSAFGDYIVRDTVDDVQGLKFIKEYTPTDQVPYIRLVKISDDSEVANIRLSAVKECNIVTFDLNGGTIDGKQTIDSQYVPVGEKATKPEDPVRKNSIFKWWSEKDSTTAFDFETDIEEDTDLVAQYHQHEWEYTQTGNVIGNIRCVAADDSYECPYSDGFDVILDVKDVYHKGKVDVKLVDPSSEEGFPDEYFTVGGIEFYKGTVTEDFDDKDTVPYDTVKNTEGTYTARVKISENSNRPAPDHDLFQSFQVVSAEPVAAQGLVYKDGKVVVTDDGLRPKDTTAIVLYKHPATGKYVSREELLNDGSIPVGETVIDYIVLPNDDYDPDNPEKFQIGYGEVTIDIAARTFLITYDLNGGKLGSDTGKIVWEVEEGTVITLPAPTRDGYEFDYWEGSRYNAGDKYTVTGDHTFKAVWKAANSGKKADSGKKKGVNTGDTNDIAGLLALMLASAGALGAIGYRRRREDQ